MTRDIKLTDKKLKITFTDKKGTLHREEDAIEFYEDESGYLTSIIFKNSLNFKTGFKLNFKETYDQDADSYYFYLFTPPNMKVGYTKAYSSSVIIDFNTDHSIFGIEILDGARKLAKNISKTLKPL
jgi:uncharacterized protein YuzE